MGMRYKLAVCLIFLIAFSACNPRELPVIRDGVRKLDEQTTLNTDAAIAKNPELKDLDELCNAIPKHESFQLYGKSIGRNKPLKLFHNYKSAEDFRTADSRFSSYFANSGWNSKDDIGTWHTVREFTNEKYRVTIQYGGMSSNANYGFSCELRK